MKKYFLLTSILMLAACGGGSGGGGGSSGSASRQPRAIIEPGSPVATEVQESNANITSMASEILVANNGVNHAPLLGRSARATYGGQTYTSYRLDDVNFRFAGEETASLKFGLDANGKIISAGRYENNDLSSEGRFTRSGDDSNLFGSSKTQYAWTATITNDGLATALTNGGNIPDGYTASGVANIISQHFSTTVQTAKDSSSLTSVEVKEALINEVRKELEDVFHSQSAVDQDALEDAFADALDYYSDQIDNAVIGDPQPVKMKLKIIGANANLKYADFGAAHIRKSNEGETIVMEDVYAPYLGGYDIIAVDQNNITDGTTFSGKVVAGIDHSTKTNGVKRKEGVLVRTNDAELTMNHDGSAQLVMENLVVDGHNDQQWYDVTIQTNANNVPTVTVSGTNTITGYDLPNKEAGSWVVSFDAGDYDAEDHEFIKNVGTGMGDSGTRQSGYLKATAYGLDGTPEEAIAGFAFGDQEYHNNNQDQNGVSIYGAFGGTVNP